MRCAKISASHHEFALGGRRDLSTWAVTLVPSRVLKAPTMRRRTYDRLRNALRPVAVTTTSARRVSTVRSSTKPLLSRCSGAPPRHDRM